MIYLANKGYLSIKELPGKEIDLIGSRGFVIEKVKDYDGDNESEKIFLMVYLMEGIKLEKGS